METVATDEAAVASLAGPESTGKHKSVEPQNAATAPRGIFLFAHLHLEAPS
jgi:hypothetical protein